MFIDTHCHISKEDYSDITSLIKSIDGAGVKKIITNGVDRPTDTEVLELIKSESMIYGAIGFHPTELEKVTESDFEWLEECVNNDKIVAIGEIGLDYHYENTNKEIQQWAFRRQLEIAQRKNIPVIIHSRDAISDTYNILREYNTKGSIHCFSGSLEMALNFIELGYLIGVGGVVTYKNAKNIVNVINNISLEYILLETDAPYLTPEPKRGEKNSPSNIPLIAKKIAEIKGVDIEIVEKTTGENAKRLFDKL